MGTTVVRWHRTAYPGRLFRWLMLVEPWRYPGRRRPLGLYNWRYRRFADPAWQVLAVTRVRWEADPSTIGPISAAHRSPALVAAQDTLDAARDVPAAAALQVAAAAVGLGEIIRAMPPLTWRPPPRLRSPGGGALTSTRT